MKKILFIAIVMAMSVTCYAQGADSLKRAIQKNAETLGHGGANELKFNLLLAISGMPEFTYERLIEDNMGVGVSLLFGLDNKVDTKFALTPHFRVYFGSKKANGFFIEGNANVVTSKSHDIYYYNNNNSTMVAGKEITNLGLGAAIGGKFITRNGFLGEAYLGASRLFDNNSGYYGDEAFPRIGITLGKRF